MGTAIKNKSAIAAVVSFLVTLPCAYLLICKSVLNWTFRQEAYKSAIMELLVVFVIMCFTTCLFRKRKRQTLVLLVLEAMLFCFLHAYLVAILAGALYVVEIYLLGRTIMRLKPAAELKENFWMCIVAGMSGQIILVGIASLLLVGTADKLRWIVAGLLVVLLFINRTVIAGWIGSITQTGIKDAPMFENKIQACLFAAICVLFLLQAGRANISLDYDSLWYGLRSEYMLAPETGIYDKIISAGSVYVYSKGIEILSLPFSGLSSTGIVYITNLFLGLGILKCVYDICRFRLTKTLSMLVTAAVAATPAVMNMTITAKSDIPSTFAQVVVIYFAARAINEKNANWYGAAMATGLLSFVFKSSALVFSCAMMVVCALFWVLQKVKFQASCLLPVTVCVAALAVVWGRTVYLVGIPSNFLFPMLYKALGIPMNYPYSFGGTGGVMSPITLLTNGTILKERIVRLWYVLFAPINDEAVHTIVAWSGILFAIVCLLTIGAVCFRLRNTLARMQKDPFYAFLILLFFLIGGMSLGCMMILRVSDGNYFQLWYVLTFVFAAYEFDGLVRKDGHAVVVALVAPMLAFQFLVCMASSWGWSVGLTSIQPERLGYYDNRADIQTQLNQLGMGNVYDALAQESGQRVLLFAGDDDMRKLMIPAAVDLWNDLHNYGGKFVIQTAEDFLKYVHTAGVDKFVLEIDFLQKEIQAKTLLSELAEQGYLEADLVDNEYALVSVRELAGVPDPDLLGILEESATIVSGCYEDSWAGRQTVIQVVNEKPVLVAVRIYYPKEITGNEKITVELDGTIVGEYLLTDATMTISIPVEIAGQHQLVLDNPFASAAAPPDVREDLAYIISGVIVEKLA